jgi:hypothetical protein
MFWRGFVSDLPGLNEAVLRVSCKGAHEEQPQDITAKLLEWPQMLIRHEHKYGHELKPGWNEIIADFFFPAGLMGTDYYKFTVELTLPDGRVLSCFEAIIHIDHDPHGCVIS